MTAVFLRYVYGIRTWDYSKHRFNYKGVISLRMSIGWIILSLFYYFYVNPFVKSTLSLADHDIRLHVLAVVIFVISITDTVVSTKRVLEIKKSGIPIDKYANIRIAKW